MEHYGPQDNEQPSAIPVRELASVWSHEASEAERAVAEAWERANPDVAERLRQVWTLSAGRSREDSREHSLKRAADDRTTLAWLAFQSRVQNPTAGSPNRPPRRLRGKIGVAPRFSLARIAIGVSAAFGIAFMANRYRAPVSDVRHASTVYTTSTGQRATVTLSDGSRVTLAPRTTLRVLAFDARARTVALDGEAYFTVSSKHNAPFIVTTNRMSARVLGTAFDIRHYADDAYARISVASGKVAVVTPERPAEMLTVGMVAHVTDSAITRTIAEDVTQYSAWTEGSLVFRKAPAVEVLAAVTRWYGYEFRYADSALVRQNLTVWLSTTSAAEALATVRQTLEVDMTFDGRTVTLRPRRGTREVPTMRHNRQHMTTIHESEVGR